MNQNIRCTIVSGEKNGRKWEALKVEVGEWSTLIFAKTKFELDYIKKQLGVIDVKGNLK